MYWSTQTHWTEITDHFNGTEKKSSHENENGWTGAVSTFPSPLWKSAGCVYVLCLCWPQIRPDLKGPLQFWSCYNYSKVISDNLYSTYKCSLFPQRWRVWCCLYGSVHAACGKVCVWCSESSCVRGVDLWCSWDPPWEQVSHSSLWKYREPQKPEPCKPTYARC